MWRRLRQGSLGLAVGLAARLLFPGHSTRGVLLSGLMGMAGAAAAAWIGELLRLYAPEEPAGFVMSALGAIASILVFSLLMEALAA